MTARFPAWRPLRVDEAPFAAKGCGPAGTGAICCPDFDTYAEYEVVLVEVPTRTGNRLRGYRNAKQGPHVLLICGLEPHDECICACGRTFTRAEAQIRGIQ